MIRARREVNYRIHAFPSQRRFYDSSARYSGFSGPVGCGKTFALVYKALQMAAANPGCTGLLGAPTPLERMEELVAGPVERQQQKRAIADFAMRRCQMTSAGRKVQYEIYPFPSQRRFIESPARYTGFSGPVGSGKSFALVYKALRMATQNPGCMGLLGAPTIPMLKSVTIRAMLESGAARPLRSSGSS